MADIQKYDEITNPNIISNSSSDNNRPPELINPALIDDNSSSVNIKSNTLTHNNKFKSTSNQPLKNISKDVKTFKNSKKTSKHFQKVPVYKDVLESKKITFKSITKHLTGPTVSIIIHILSIITVGSIIVFSVEKPNDTINITMQNLKIQEVITPPKAIEPISKEVDDLKEDVNIDSPEIEPNIEIEINDKVANVESIELETDFLDLNISTNNSMLKLPGIYAMRNNLGRRQCIKKYNTGSRSSSNSKKIEISTNKALNWLGNNQNLDGSWGEGKNISAFSGLATLALLAHGETPSSNVYGEVMLKAFKYLCQLIEDEDAIPNGYATAIVAYAISEGYAISKIQMLEHSMNKIMKRVIKGMNPQGSYTYNYYTRKRVISDSGRLRMAKTGEVGTEPPRSDLSLAGWHYQAIKAAYSAGCEVPGLIDAIKLAKIGLKKTNYRGYGQWFYSNTKTEEENQNNINQIIPVSTMDNVGMLCLQLLGEGTSKEVVIGLKRFSQLPENLDARWDKKGVHQWALYLWYYQTQVLFQGFQGKGKIWKKWNKSFTSNLIKEQESDGHWISPIQKYGAIHDEGESNLPALNEDGNPKKTSAWGKRSKNEHPINLKVYSTALCTLMLTVYYRYLPTYKLTLNKKKTDISDDDFDLSLD